MATGSSTIEREQTNTSADSSREAAERKRAWANRSLLLPAIIFSVVLTQIPFIVTIYYSTINWNLLYPQEKGFTGLDNYRSVFSSGDLFPSIRATLLITGLSVVGSLLLGLMFAILLNRAFRGRAIARTLMITPFLIMPAAAALIWKYSMFDTNIGMLNWVMRSLGLDTIAWGTDYPLATVVIVLIWQFTPFMMLILLAGLQAQSLEALEAARVDGASTFQIFWYLTLPHLRMYAEISGLLGIIILLQVFDPIAILTKGTGGTKTLAYLLYERAFIGLDVGEAAAYGVVSVVLTIIFASITLKTLFGVFMKGGER
jgi:sorbitol/mannitol transport system permease protein